MKTNLILKAILLYITGISILLFLAGGCESLIENKQSLLVLIWLILDILLIYLCIKYISYKELYKLSGVEILDTIHKNK